MELSSVLAQLAHTLTVPVTPTDGQVTAAVAGESTAADVLGVDSSAVTTAKGQVVATLTATTPLAALETLGRVLHPAAAINAAVMPIAVAAITASLTDTLAAAATLLAAPVIVLDLTGQQILKATSGALDAATPTGRFLSTHRPALDPKRFWHHLYITTPDQSPSPLLLTPLMVGNTPLAYLAVGAVGTPLTAKQTQLLPALAPIVANAAAREHLVATPVGSWDRLLNLLLTEQYDATFAAQFSRAGAVLPSQMVLLRAQPLAAQSAATLRARLQQLLAPMHAQVILTVYRHLCLALVTVSLPTYNSTAFHQQLALVASRANCQLIVSAFYTKPADTVAAYQVTSRAAALGSLPAVVFCEDLFFELMLAQVADRDNILPYFLNPAIKALQDYDAKSHTALVATLQAFLAAGGNLTATAAGLYLHPNTLRHRLQRITALTGLDLKAAPTRVKLTNSFAVIAFLQQLRLQ